MRRKSERNKAKASPEKKPEPAKPTRKSTRRRGRKSPSASPEPEAVAEKKAPEVPEAIPEEEEEVAPQEAVAVADAVAEEVVKNAVENDDAPTSSSGDGNQAEEDKSDKSSPGAEGGVAEEVVWKVARADASPGEIQKLKLCRQRNVSDASSDGSGSKTPRKSSTRRQAGASGEGHGDEDDSAEEQPRSSPSKRPAALGLARTGGASSPSSRGGGGGHAEVSSNREAPPESASPGLSKLPHLDRPGVNEKAEVVEDATVQEAQDGGDIVQQVKDEVQEVEDKSEQVQAEDKPEQVQAEDKPQEVEDEPPKVQVEEATMEVEDKVEEPEKEVASKEDEEGSRSSREEEEEKEEKEEEQEEAKEKGVRKRRKGRGKYRDSSESEDEDEEEEVKGKREVEEKRRKSPTPVRKEEDAKDEGKDKEEEGNVEVVVNNKAEQRPAKVNLKRSFIKSFNAAKPANENAETNDNGEAVDQNKENQSNESKSVPKRRRWGSVLTTDTIPEFSISTDSLKALVPGAKPLSLKEVRLSKDDEDDSHKPRERKHSLTNASAEPKIRVEDKKADSVNDNHTGKRKIVIMKERDSPSSPAAQATNVLLIKNLVRPFTMFQIKELLSRTGTIVENGFWMDRIKSKCYVEYSSEDHAFETRQALDGISWPQSNPKKLLVEYATKEDMQLAKESLKDQPIVRKTEPVTSSDTWQQGWTQEEKITTNNKVQAVREWDLGKEDGQMQLKEKERERKDSEKKKRQHSRSPAPDARLPAPARKFKKKEDEPPPAKLLDDLFKKTKASPCIYWLPLTEEQIAVKKEIRRQRMAEHALRLEEMRRTERTRDRDRTRERERDRDRRRNRSPRK